MNYKLLDHSYIALTILFTVYSQLIIRWQVSLAGDMPEDFIEKIRFILGLLINPWVFSGVTATFFSGISWMLAMTKFDISYAYPFISLNYILILVAGFLVFNEPVSTAKLTGSFLVVLGIIILARG